MTKGDYGSDPGGRPRQGTLLGTVGSGSRGGSSVGGWGGKRGGKGEKVCYVKSKVGESGTSMTEKLDCKEKSTL